MTAAAPRAGGLLEFAARGLALDTDLATPILTGFIREELGKVGFDRAVVALSGGIDSALVCALAARALGPENVLAVLMPYRTSSPDSRGDAEELVEELGVGSTVVEITPMVEPYFRSQPEMSPVRQGNVMARARMIVVYDHSVKFGGLVLGTSNKSELLLGYGTLFGDLASAANPIGDLYKTQVRQMAVAFGIPAKIVQKPPSADLWVGQSDEEDLGFSYDWVDRILFLLFDERYPPAELIEAGVPAERVNRVYEMVRANQFKRRPPIIAKISERTIDRDFRYPRDWGR